MSDASFPVSRAQERLAVAALTVGAFVVSVNVHLIGALGPYVLGDPLYRDLSPVDGRSTLVQLFWITPSAAALTSLLLGPIVDRVGRRGPVALGSLLFAVAMAGHYFVASHGELVVLRALSGLGGGLVFTGASAAVADLVPYHRRAASMGVFSLGMFLAVPVGLPVGLLLSETGEGSWRLAFAWLTIPGLLAVPALLRFLPHGLGRSNQTVSQLAVLSEPYVVPSLLSVLLYTGAFSTSVAFLAKWLDDPPGLLAKEDQLFLWVVLGLSTAVGSVFLPRIADRVGKLNVVLVTTAAVAICLIVLARFVNTLQGLWLVGIPMTLLAAARTPALQALMSEIVEPRMRGTLMGLRATAVNVGAALFAWAGGSVYARQGYDALLYAAAAAMVMAYMLMRFFVRVRL